jgi:tetratricopeptide (TPR) repeat protein
MKRYFILLFIITLPVFSQTEIWLANGHKALEKHDYKEAEKAFTKALAISSNSSDALYGRGLARLYSGNLEGAESDFSDAIEIDTNFVDAYNSRGTVYMMKGDLLKATNDLNRVIEKDPKYGEAYLNRGSINLALNLPADALNDFNEASKLLNDNPETFFYRAKAYYYLQMLDSALADNTKALDLGVDNAEIYYDRGNILYKTGEYESAAEAYTKSIEKDTTLVEAINNRAMAYDALGNFDLADKDRKKIKQLNKELYNLPDISTIKFKTFSTANGDYSIDLPADWQVFNDIKSEFATNMVAAQDKITSDTAMFSVGVQLSLNFNMKELTGYSEPDSLIALWHSSVAVNNADYYNYSLFSTKLTKIGDYNGILNKSVLQVSQNSAPIRLYELVLAKENTLFYAYFQAPQPVFAYYQDIFEKSISTLKINR